MTKIAALGLLLVLASAGEEARPGDPVHEIRLRSGTTLVGRIGPADWNVTTPFGPLAVPAREVVRVRFGRRADAERFKRVESLMLDLASANPEKRAYAHAMLTAEGPYASPSLADAADTHTDPDVRRVCREILDGMETPEEGRQPDDDTVETSRFSIVGAVGIDTFTVEVPELGSLSVKRKDVVEISGVGARRGGRFKVTGANTMMEGWVDTGIEIPDRCEMRISADGGITYPQSWRNIVFRPDGDYNYGNFNGIPMCCLIGRIGETGETFRIGRGFSGRPAGEGTLQLAVASQMQGQPSTGEFKVRVEVR
jgi:hypothetical protein